MDSPYKILGLKEYTPLRQVKAAYHILSMKYHPDINGDTDDNRREFYNINQAYNTIKTDVKKFYDFLELSSNADIDDIDAAYNSKMDILHLQHKEGKTTSAYIEEMKKYYMMIKSTIESETEQW